MASNDSILKTIRVVSGLPDDDTSFDDDLKLYINGALANLNQVGATLDSTNVIDDTATWSSITLPSPVIQAFVKLYVLTSTRLNFDPPAPSALSYMTASLNETLWRVGVEVDKYRKEEVVDGA